MLKNKKILGFIGLLILLTLLFFYFSRKDSPSEKTPEKNSNTVEAVEKPSVVEKTKTPKEETPIKAESPLKKYNKQIISYTSPDGKVEGTGGILYDAYGDQLNVTFNFYVKEIPTKSDTGYTYPYAGKLIGASKIISGSLISPRFCGYTEIGSPFSYYYEDVYKCGTEGKRVTTPTQFYVTFNVKTKSYEDLINLNKLEIWEHKDGAAFIAPEKIFTSGKINSSYAIQVSATPVNYKK